MDFLEDVWGEEAASLILQGRRDEAVAFVMARVSREYASAYRQENEQTIAECIANLCVSTQRTGKPRSAEKVQQEEGWNRFQAQKISRLLRARMFNLATVMTLDFSTTLLPSEAKEALDTMKAGMFIGGGDLVEIPLSEVISNFEKTTGTKGKPARSAQQGEEYLFRYGDQFWKETPHQGEYDDEPQLYGDRLHISVREVDQEWKMVPRK